MEVNRTIKLSQKHFNSIQVTDKLLFVVDNSSEAIDQDGSDFYNILLDLRSGEIIQQTSNNDKSKAFLNSYVCGIPSDYISHFKAFVGGWSVNAEDHSWYVSFHGEHEDNTKNMNPKLLEEILNAVNSKTMLAFLQDVLKKVK